MYFIGLIIGYCISGLIFGFVCQHVAESKGYSTGFAWGFWLGMIGLIVVAVKPDIRQTAPVAYTPMYPSAAPAPEKKWTCTCGAKNGMSLSYCTACRRTRGEANPVRKVACPHCGASNNENNATCFACNRSMKEEPAAPAAVPAAAAPAAAAPAAPATVTPAPSAAEIHEAAELTEKKDLCELLEKLYGLHERGILTDEEYTQKKAQILERM